MILRALFMVSTRYPLEISGEAAISVEDHGKSDKGA